MLCYNKNDRSDLGDNLFLLVLYFAKWPWTWQFKAPLVATTHVLGILLLLFSRVVPTDFRQQLLKDKFILIWNLFLKESQFHFDFPFQHLWIPLFWKTIHHFPGPYNGKMLASLCSKSCSTWQSAYSNFLSLCERASKNSYHCFIFIKNHSMKIHAWHHMKTMLSAFCMTEKW